MSLDIMQDHIRTLVQSAQVYVIEVPHIAFNSALAASLEGPDGQRATWWHTIAFVPVTDARTYWAALHELGHVHAGRSELAAWQWAKRHTVMPWDATVRQMITEARVSRQQPHRWVTTYPEISPPIYKETMQRLDRHQLVLRFALRRDPELVYSTGRLEKHV